MDVQVEKTGSYLCKLSVSIPATDVETAFDKALRKIGKQAQLPGFRPGKVPRSVVERQFGAQINQEVQSQLVEDTLFRAMDEQQLTAVAYPRLQNVSELSRGASFSYVAEVEVRPEITMSQWEGLAAPKPDNAIDEAELSKELETMRTQGAQLVPVEGRDEAQDGDVVQVDYAGFIDGVAFDGGKADNALVELGGSGYIPGFAEGLVGAKVPGEREITVTFPADYQATDLAGKEAKFQVKLHELKTRELPKLDDEWAKDMGEDSLEALQGKLRDSLQQRKDAEVLDVRRTAVLKALVAANAFDVPPSMVSSQVERIVAGAAARVERMVGQRMNFTPEQLAGLRSDSMADAEFQVRSGLLMLEVAKAAKLETTDAEVVKEIDTLAKQAGDQAERLRAYYDAAERREELKFRMLEDKVVELLLERSVEGPAIEEAKTEDKPAQA